MQSLWGRLLSLLPRFFLVVFLPTRIEMLVEKRAIFCPLPTPIRATTRAERPRSGGAVPALAAECRAA